MNSENNQVEKIVINNGELVFITHPSNNTSIIVASKKEDSVLEHTSTDELLDRLYSFSADKDYSGVFFRTLEINKNLLIKSNVDNQVYKVQPLVDGYKIASKQNLNSSSNIREKSEILGQ